MCEDLTEKFGLGQQVNEGGTGLVYVACLALNSPALGTRMLLPFACREGTFTQRIYLLFSERQTAVKNVFLALLFLMEL